MAGESDLDLIARVLAAGDHRAFGALVARHEAVVRALLRRLTGGDAARADDLAQETFLRAWRGLAGYRGGARFSTWLHRIGWNVFLSSLEKERLDPLEPGEEPETEEPDPARKLDLEQAMAELRLEERVALALTFGKDLSHEEAASLLGWPLGTLKSHVERARKKLARRLHDWRDDG